MEALPHFTIKLRMVLYYITDRRSLVGPEAQQRLALLERVAAAARAGVDYIQLREKDLPPRALEQLAREVVQAVRENSSTTKVLINGRTDVALAVSADGVHLPSDEVAASEIRTLWMAASHRAPLIGVSAHSVADVRYAEAHGADFAVIAPVFEKVSGEVKTIGLDPLRAACRGEAAWDNTEGAAESHFPVLALGGVTVSNVGDCVEAGAAGVAGIRLFQQGDIGETVRRLRSL